MSIFEVVVTGTQYVEGGDVEACELTFMVAADTDEQAIVSITTGLRVRSLETVTNVRTVRL